MEVKCYKCHSTLDLAPEQSVARSEECPSCMTSIRCCHMCKFYDVHAYNECKEPVAERIIDKEKANFCDHYILMDPKNSPKKSEDLLAAANALFKK